MPVSDGYSMPISLLQCNNYLCCLIIEVRLRSLSPTTARYDLEDNRDTRTINNGKLHAIVIDIKESEKGHYWRIEITDLALIASCPAILRSPKGKLCFINGMIISLKNLIEPL